MRLGCAFGPRRTSLLQPTEPGVDPLACLRGHLEHPRVGHHARETIFDGGHVEVEMRDQVHLGQQDEIGLLKHHGILERLVLPLGDRQRDDVCRLTQIVDRWADQVANVLDEEDVAVVRRKIMKSVMDEPSVEMTSGACRDRRRRDAGRVESIRVTVGGEVAAHRTQFEPPRAGFRRCLEDRGLASSGGAHQVDRKQP